VTQWREQLCLDFYQQWQISQTDQGISSNYGKNLAFQHLEKAFKE